VIASLSCLLVLIAQAEAGAPASTSGLDGNDHLALSLSTGEVVEGWYYDADAQVVVLSGDNRFVEVPLSLVIGVVHDDEPEPLDVFFADVDQARQRSVALTTPMPPPPGAVIGLSLVWAGAGHAALGEWRGALSYSIVECAVAGTAAWNITHEPNLAVLVPLAGLDLLFKGYAAGEAARIARSRRSRHRGERRRPASTGPSSRSR